jgi:hypothetical protein
MPDPIDLDAIRAAREAAELPSIPLRFGGDDFTVPNYAYWPAEAQEALVLGNLRLAFEEILGPAQFDKFWSHHPSIGDLNDLMDELDRRVMAGRGNSPRSSPSSGSTSKPSTPTSGPSTGSTSPPRASRKGPSAKRPGASKP